MRDPRFAVTARDKDKKGTARAAVPRFALAFMRRQ
jgi:hypothetical protein